MDVARLQVVIEANTAAVEAGFARTSALLEQLNTRSSGASMGFGKLTASFAAGQLAANALTGTISRLSGLFEQAGGSVLDLSSRLEQARIGFTTMLGSVAKADEFIGRLQQKAESTAFNFPGIQQIAQQLLAMGTAADNVIPIIDDMSNALSAAGKGGSTEALERVGASLAEIQAQGKLSGEQIRELSRNGIAVIPMLTEAFGKTGAEIRKMTEAGEISGARFFEIFHDYVNSHYGDIQAKQAQTWAVAASNVQDIVGRLATQTLKELTDSLTQAALGLNNFLHSDRVIAWAADVKQAIHEVLTALEPLTGAMMGAMGGTGITAPTGPTVKPAPPVSRQSRDAWMIPADANTSVQEYNRQITEAGRKIHGIATELAELGSKKTTLQFTIEDIKLDFQDKIRALEDEQVGLNQKILETKEHYEALLDPLQRMQTQLTRLAEDTKADFARILDPLKDQLDGVNRKIADSKSAYETLVRPIQAQIDGIERANRLLQRQIGLANDIADVELKARQLAAIGDPGKRADIAGRMKLVELNRQDLQNQLDLLEATNKKGRNDKAIDDLQKQINAKKAEEIRLEQAAAGLVDKNAMAEIERQRVLNEATRDQNDLLLKKADITARQQEAPLQDQIAAAQAQLKTVLEPLEAQQQALGRAIQDVAKAESEALKPIVAAQAQVARQIQDIQAELKAILDPMEKRARDIAAAIAALGAGMKAALDPYEAQMRALERLIAKREEDKKAAEIAAQALKDRLKEVQDRAKDAADAVAKVPLALAGADTGDRSKIGTPEGPLFGPPMPNRLIPPELLTDIHNLAENVAQLNDRFAGLNASLSAVGLPLQSVLTTIGNFALASVVVALVGRLAAVIASLVSPAGLAVAALTTLLTAIQNWSAIQGIVADVDSALKTFFENVHNWTDEHIAGPLADLDRAWANLGSRLKADREAWLLEWKGWWDDALTTVQGLPAAIGQVFSDMGTNIKTATDLMLKPTSQGGSNPFPDLQAVFDGFLQSVGPTVDNITRIFAPLAQALGAIADALSKLPNALPDWLTRALGGGGLQRTSLQLGPERGAIGGDAMSLSRGFDAGATGANADVITTIVTTAMRHSIDPLIALALAKAESGFNPRAVGDSGASVGLFQLHEAGQGAGMSFEQRADPGINAEKFLGAHEALFQQLKAEGLAGEELAATFGRLAEVSDPQFAYRYADAYRQLAAQFGGTEVVQQRLDTSTVRFNDTLLTQQQVAEATAKAQSGLATIIAQGGQATAAAVQPTQALAAAQQHATTWADTMAQQNAALADALSHRVVPGSVDAATAIQNMGRLVEPVVRQVAHGGITTSQLADELVNLADAVGVTSQPFIRLQTGVEDSQAALEEVIQSIAASDPRFQGLLDQLNAVGGSSRDVAIQFLQLLNSIGKLPATTDAAAQATQGVAAAADAATQAIDPLGGGRGALLNDTAAGAVNLANALKQADENFRTIQESARAATSQFQEFFDAAKHLGDYLDDHEFHVKINVDKIPWWAEPGSPTPFELGLRGIADGLREVNSLAAPSLRGLGMPGGQSQSQGGPPQPVGRERDLGRQVSPYNHDERTLNFYLQPGEDAEDVLARYDRVESRRARYGG